MSFLRIYRGGGGGGRGARVVFLPLVGRTFVSVVRVHRLRGVRCPSPSLSLLCHRHVPSSNHQIVAIVMSSPDRQFLGVPVVFAANRVEPRRTYVKGSVKGVGRTSVQVSPPSVGPPSPHRGKSIFDAFHGCLRDSVVSTAFFWKRVNCLLLSFGVVSHCCWRGCC